MSDFRKIILVDIDPDVVESFKKYFSTVEGFEIECKSIFDVDPDLVVSPANSFGFLNGGIDGFYTKVMGSQVQENLQRKIKDNFYGELLVGQSTLIETDYKKVPYLIASPTMRLPQRLTGTINVYLAAKATFNLIKSGVLSDSVKTIAIPGFGTATGGLEPDLAIKQMWEGYVDSYKPNFPNSLFAAHMREDYLKSK
jgi:O-acetyl-ADP-ribose deacetylase (regulator of RNase III)